MKRKLKKYVAGVQSVGKRPKAPSTDASGIAMGAMGGVGQGPAGVLTGLFTGIMAHDKQKRADQEAYEEEMKIYNEGLNENLKSKTLSSNEIATQANQSGAKGAKSANGEVEVEEGETLMRKTPTGKYVMVERVKGDKHSEGGEDRSLPEGTIIFPAKWQKRVEKAYNEQNYPTLESMRVQLPKETKDGKAKAGLRAWDPDNKWPVKDKDGNNIEYSDEEIFARDEAERVYLEKKNAGTGYDKDGSAFIPDTTNQTRTPEQQSEIARNAKAAAARKAKPGYVKEKEQQIKDIMKNLSHEKPAHRTSIKMIKPIVDELGLSVNEIMNGNKTFNSAGKNYDYEAAISLGVSPDADGKWPVSDSDSGIILAGTQNPIYKNHPNVDSFKKAPDGRMYNLDDKDFAAVELREMVKDPGATYPDIKKKIEDSGVGLEQLKTYKGFNEGLETKYQEHKKNTEAGEALLKEASPEEQAKIRKILGKNLTPKKQWEAIQDGVKNGTLNSDTALAFMQANPGIANQAQPGYTPEKEYNYYEKYGEDLGLSDFEINAGTMTPGLTDRVKRNISTAIQESLGLDFKAPGAGPDAPIDEEEARQGRWRQERYPKVEGGPQANPNMGAVVTSPEDLDRLWGYIKDLGIDTPATTEEELIEKTAPKGKGSGKKEPEYVDPRIAEAKRIAEGPQFAKDFKMTTFPISGINSPDFLTEQAKGSAIPASAGENQDIVEQTGGAGNLGNIGGYLGQGMAALLKTMPGDAEIQDSPEVELNKLRYTDTSGQLRQEAAINERVAASNARNAAGGNIQSYQANRTQAGINKLKSLQGIDAEEFKRRFAIANRNIEIDNKEEIINYGGDIRDQEANAANRAARRNSVSQGFSELGELSGTIARDKNAMTNEQKLGELLAGMTVYDLAGKFKEEEEVEDVVSKNKGRAVQKPITY
jgi:hypothetical protein